VEEIIRVEDVTRRFGRTTALNDVSLSMPKGIVLGLVGENGAGKTTLIKHLLGLLRAREGRVRVFGKDPVNDPEYVLARLGYLSEHREDLPGWMRIRELFRYTRAFYPKWDSGYAQELCETFGLDPDQRIKTLSKGQKVQSGWLASFVLLVVFAHVKGHSREFFELIAGYYESIGLGRLVFICLFVTILSWTAMALGASRAMVADSRWIQWLPRLGILAISLPLIYFHSRGMITPAQYVTLIKTFCCVAGLYCWSRTILAFYRARKKRLISDRMIGVAALGWIVLCLASAYALWRLFDTGSGGDRLSQEFTPEYSVAFMVVFMLAGLLMLPFAPLATAPLALARSRSH